MPCCSVLLARGAGQEPCAGSVPCLRLWALRCHSTLVLQPRSNRTEHVANRVNSHPGFGCNPAGVHSCIAQCLAAEDLAATQPGACRRDHQRRGVQAAHGGGQGKRRAALLHDGAGAGADHRRPRPRHRGAPHQFVLRPQRGEPKVARRWHRCVCRCSLLLGVPVLLNKATRGPRDGYLPLRN